jgi:hypothetical protein
MRKIASPMVLQAELRCLLEYSQGQNPSRKVLASRLRVLAEEVASETEASANESLRWGTFADACDVTGRELLKLANEADGERRHAGEHREDIQKIFEAVKKSQLAVDHAVILANSLATKLRKAK